MLINTERRALSVQQANFAKRIAANNQRSLASSSPHRRPRGQIADHFADQPSLFEIAATQTMRRMMKLIRVVLFMAAVCLNGRRKAVDCASSPFDAQLYKSNQFPGLHVWLTINPDVKLFDNPFKAIVLKQRLFELNWAFKAQSDADKNSNQLDWIALFDKAPSATVSVCFIGFKLSRLHFFAVWCNRNSEA